MQTDIDHDKEIFEEMEYEGEEDWTPIYDPKAFAEKNDELKIEDFKLKISRLEEYAI